MTLTSHLDQLESWSFSLDFEPMQRLLYLVQVPIVVFSHANEGIAASQYELGAYHRESPA